MKNDELIVDSYDTAVWQMMVLLRTRFSDAEIAHYLMDDCFMSPENATFLDAMDEENIDIGTMESNAVKIVSAAMEQGAELDRLAKNGRFSMPESWSKRFINR